MCARIWRSLADALYRHLPSGVGVKGNLHINKSELDEILHDGSQWALREGFARPRTSRTPKRAAAWPAPIRPR